MKKEQMVGTRLPEDLIRDLETIQDAEQSDRSTTVRKLLYKAVRDWKLEHYGRLYADGRVSLARAAKGERSAFVQGSVSFTPCAAT